MIKTGCVVYKCVIDFYIHDLSRSLFFKVRFLLLMLASLISSTVIDPFTTIYTLS